MGRFETELLATDENVEALVDMNGVWIDKVHDRHPPKMIILDMDSSVSPTHGEQEGTAYNGHFGCTCYHPLFLFNQFGDLERCSLRPGNVHSADGWRNVLEPVVMRYKERKVVKIGAKVVRHGRYVTFQLAKVAVPRDLFRKILSLIDDLRRRPAPA